MAKPNKVRYSGVVVLANGYTLSRVQNVNISSDMGVEEVKELGYTEVVEYTAAQPKVTISLETNEYGSCRNLRAILGITGQTSATIGITEFDNARTDISLLVKEDLSLARSAIIQDAFLTSIAWNYDVGGVSRETYNFDADNKTWFTGAKKETVSIMGVPTMFDCKNVGTASGYFKCVFPYDMTVFTGYKMYTGGIQVTGLLYESEPEVAPFGQSAGWTTVTITGNNTLLTGGTYPKLICYKKTPETADIMFKTSRNPVGSIPRGRLNLYLVSGWESLANTSSNATNALRLQTVSITAELARETLNELGHYRAVEQSLTYPVPVNITFSALSSDLAEYATFQGKSFAITEEYNITDFLKTALLRVEIYDKNDIDQTRVLKKSITISGIQVISEATSVDVGGNATQEFTTKANNILIAGTVGECLPCALSSGLTYSD